MYVGLLAEHCKDVLDDESRVFMGYAEEGAKRMSNLIKDLLAYSRVNRLNREPVVVDAESAMNDALAALQLRIEETNAVITHDKLPTVMADPTQLMQIFQNLFENAIKYRKENEPPRIHVSAEEKEHHWVFSVKDNGIGIDPQFHEKIFQAFQRLHADRSKYPGSGIGLAIVKRIVERQHGFICVDSKPGEGSTFYFTLPREVKESSASSQASQAGENPLG
jgi:chemotaxis family two-component system sensor kinase Cph1